MIRNIVSNELPSLLLVFGLIIIATAKLTSPSRFEHFLVVLVNDKYLKIYSRDRKILNLFDSLLFINLIMMLSLFGVIMYQHINNTGSLSITYLSKWAVYLMAFIIIKMMIESLVAKIFDIDKLINAYLFQKISYKNYLGILLLPINALLIYTFNPVRPFFSVFICLILIINLLSLFNLFKTHQSLIKKNFFYFILYICALEIAPLVVLYKMSF